jgi:hypothetical protein
MGLAFRFLSGLTAFEGDLKAQPPSKEKKPGIRSKPPFQGTEEQSRKSLTPVHGEDIPAAMAAAAARAGSRRLFSTSALVARKLLTLPAKADALPSLFVPGTILASHPPPFPLVPVPTLRRCSPLQI